MLYNIFLHGMSHGLTMNIATHCDGTVLVVRGGETPRKVVGDSVQQLKRTGVPLLGVVLDRAEMNSTGSPKRFTDFPLDSISNCCK